MQVDVAAVLDTCRRIPAQHQVEVSRRPRRVWNAAGSCSEMGAGTSAPRGGRGPPELFAELEDSLATRREYVHLNQHQVDDTCAEGSHSPSRKPPGLVHTCLGATSDCTSQPAVHTELWVTTGRHCGRTTLLEREPCRQGCGGASRW